MPPAPSVLSAVPSIDGRGEAGDDAQPGKGSPRAGQTRRPLETATAAGASGQGVPLAMGTLPRRAPLRPHGRRAAAPSEVTAPRGSLGLRERHVALIIPRRDGGARWGGAGRVIVGPQPSICDVFSSGARRAQRAAARSSMRIIRADDGSRPVTLAWECSVDANGAEPADHLRSR